MDNGWWLAVWILHFWEFGLRFRSGLNLEFLEWDK